MCRSEKLRALCRRADTEGLVKRGKGILFSRLRFFPAKAQDLFSFAARDQGAARPLYERDLLVPASAQLPSRCERGAGVADWLSPERSRAELLPCAGANSGSVFLLVQNRAQLTDKGCSPNSACKRGVPIRFI